VGTRNLSLWDPATRQLGGFLLAEHGSLATVSIDGHWRDDPAKGNDLVFVAHTPEEHLLLKPDEFATRFRFKNNPQRARVPTR